MQPGSPSGEASPADTLPPALDPLLYLRPEPEPDQPGRALAKAGVRALLTGLPLGLCFASSSIPGAISVVCATWIFVPLAMACGRLSERKLLALGGALGTLQAAGLLLQWSYLSALSRGLARGAALTETYRVLTELAHDAWQDPGGFAFLAGGALLWGVAWGAVHAALSERAPHLCRGGLALARIAYRILQVPALVLLPVLGVAAFLATCLARSKMLVEKAFYVGVGIVLLGAGLLWLATTLAGLVLQLSARWVEPRLLGPDPVPPRLHPDPTS